MSFDDFDSAPFKVNGTIGQILVKYVKWFLRFAREFAIKTNPDAGEINYENKL